MTSDTPSRPDPSATEAKSAGAARCRACSAAVAAGATRCGRCGAMQSDALTCALCGAVADASPDDELRFRCDVCGAPRVPLSDTAIRRSGKEIPMLKRAEAARRARAWGRTGAIVGGLGLASVFLFFTALTLIFSSATIGILGVLFSAPFGALLAWSILRAKARGKEIAPALDAAWLAVATDVAEQTAGTLTARDLANKMRIDETQAEELLAQLTVNDILRSDVTDAGEVAYNRLRVAPLPEAGARTEPPTTAGAATTGEHVAVRESAAAEEEEAEHEAMRALEEAAAKEALAEDPRNRS